MRSGRGETKARKEERDDERRRKFTSSLWPRRMKKVLLSSVIAQGWVIGRAQEANLLSGLGDLAGLAIGLLDRPERGGRGMSILR